MSEESVILGGPPWEPEHYLEAVTTRTHCPPNFGKVVSLVNNSLFCAQVCLPGGGVVVVEYPARTLLVREINMDKEKKGCWRHRIRLDYRGRWACQGRRHGLSFERFALFETENFQQMFYSGLVWVLGNYRRADSVDGG